MENNELIGVSVVCNGEGKMGSSMVVESSTVDISMMEVSPK